MLYSKLFGKTVKNAPADAKVASYVFLYRGGFIRESRAGRYYLLPLGLRVHDKIQKIIEEEMNAAGAQKMITPVLHPIELWKETNRHNSGNFGLMIVKDKRDSEFALGGTAEEMFVDLVRNFNISYKDMTFNLYQFSTKFRDELRARGGLLRVREFVMKDAYSFSTDSTSFAKEYQNMADTYFKIFKRVGLDTKMVAADNGYIGGEYSHEFIADSEAGESVYLQSEDGKHLAHADVAKFKVDVPNPDETPRPMRIIDQPEWVRTMKEFEEHYKQPKWRFLKNVVYKNISTGEIIIVGIRGDLEVNKTKVEKALGAIEQLDDATAEDLQAMGTKTGYVHSWGHKDARYIGDLSLKTVVNFIGGQKEEKTDTIDVNYGRDFECEFLADLSLAKEGCFTEDGSSRLVEAKGIEVGNIFQLGEHYSSKMGAKYMGSDSKEHYYYMGCYGIGVGRTLAAIVEKYHDDKGIIWPESVAPFKVHLVGLNLDNPDVKSRAYEVYKRLQDSNVEVLFDDREDTSAGEKFTDADLLGMPYRIVVSSKTGDRVEVKKRAGSDIQHLGIEEFLRVF